MYNKIHIYTGVYFVNRDTKVIIKGIERYTFKYRKNNTTIITIKDKLTGNTTTETRTGFVPVTVTTDGGEVKVSY